MLHFAAMEGVKELVVLMVVRGAKVNLADKVGGGEGGVLWRDGMVGRGSRMEGGQGGEV